MPIINVAEYGYQSVLAVIKTDPASWQRESIAVSQQVAKCRSFRRFLQHETAYPLGPALVRLTSDDVRFEFANFIFESMAHPKALRKSSGVSHPENARDGTTTGLAQREGIYTAPSDRRVLTDDTVSKLNRILLRRGI